MKPNYKALAEEYRNQSLKAQREKSFYISQKRYYEQTIQNLREENNCLKQKYADAMDRIIALQEKLQKMLEEQK